MRKIEIEHKPFSMKKKIAITLIILLIIAIIVLISLYIKKKSVRDVIDKYIFNKNITEEDISVINLDTDKSNQVYVYSRYIALLNDKTVTLYNSYGEEVTSIAVNINTAIFDSSNKYLAVAESNGSEICLILDKTYLWSNTIEGAILQIHVNKNGYVAVITTDSTHKSILTVYNSSGTQLFKSYFSSTRIIDVSISNDNKYVAVGELDTSGTVIQSNIKIISIENAQNDAENAIIYTYNAESNKLIISVKYQEKGQLVCMYDNSIDIIENEKNNGLLTLDDSEITLMSVNFSNYIAYIEEENTGLFKSNSNIKILNTENKQENLYTIEDIAKEIYAQDDILAVNVGTELYFFDTKGWLIKKYTASQEITDVMLSKNLATVIYKDKIIIIGL